MKTEVILSFFAKYIERELGIIYSEGNYFQLQNRLEEIARKLNKDGIEALYLEAEKGNDSSFKCLLLDMATNNETSFFRDNRVFDAFRSLVINRQESEETKLNPLKIWSAASSSGQEAISISIVISELEASFARSLPVTILGTDISDKALTKARASRYSQLEVQRGLSPELLAKYFVKDSRDLWAPSRELISRIEFKKMNLKDTDYPYSGFDFIFCRNVLIYQNIEGKKEILNKLTSKLNAGGYLILGSGESLLGLSQDYELVMVEGAAFYRKKDLKFKAA